MQRILYKNVAIWVLLIVGLLAGCSARSTPPGASSVMGGVDGARYSYHHWDEGLGILFWYDIAAGGENCDGSASTDDPVYRLQCRVQGQSGVDLEWEARTTDGVTADLTINGESYDLAEGAVFLVRSGAGGLQVEQVKVDLSQLAADNAAVEALAESDPAIAAFVAATGSP